MKIEKDKITGYAEMSAEEKIAALEGYEFTTDYTGYVKKELFDKASSEAADYKKKWKATLTEKEQLELDEAEKRKEIEEQLKQLQKEKALTDYKAKYVAQGYDEENAILTAEALLSGDMETVFEIQKKFLETRQAKIKEELMKGMKDPFTDKGGKGMTKEQFKALSLDEKNRIAIENPEFYKSMYGG